MHRRQYIPGSDYKVSARTQAEIRKAVGSAAHAAAERAEREGG